jgi:hypothetical protein
VTAARVSEAEAAEIIEKPNAEDRKLGLVLLGKGWLL